MGADLLLVAVPYEPKLDWTPRVARLTDAQVDDIADAQGWNGDGENHREAVLAACAAWQTAVDEDYRDVTTLDLGGLTYALAGGMSWGDDPSEAWGDGCIAALVVGTPN
jgi:hypothetical protein